MSSFFTLPASQKKRKRVQTDDVSKDERKRPTTSRRSRDESISGSDVSDDDRPSRAKALEVSEDEDDDEEFEDEDPATKRLRLAEQYLANTQKEVFEDGGFDAVEVDKDNLRRRMGERLKENTAENKGKLYRWIADDFNWSESEAIPFRYHQKALTGVAMCGDYIYTVSRDTVLVKWQLPSALAASQIQSGRPMSRKPKRLLTSQPFRKAAKSRPDLHATPILCVAASQDGRFVATGGSDKKLIVWDASSLKPLKVFEHHRDAVTSLAFRRGTNQLFTTSKDRTVKIWSLDELTYVETLFGHQDEAVDVSSLAEEKCVSVGARDRTARYWKVVEESQLLFRGGGAPGRSKFADRRDQSTGNEAEAPEVYHEGSIDRVACIDEETFVTGSDNGSLSLWNINKKKAVFTYPLAHGVEPPLSLAEVSAEEFPDEAARPKPQPRWITALQAIPFSDTFVTGSWDGYVRSWKISQDRRHIEFLGRIGCIEGDLDDILDNEGLNSDSFSNSALRAIQDGKEGQGRIHGFINDLAIVDRGDRAKDGLVVVAAVGKEPRLGRWKEMKAAKNCAVYFRIPRKSEEIINSSGAEDVEKGDGEGNFEGFD